MLFNVSWKRYERSDDSSSHPQSEGAAENAQENPKRLQHRHDVKGVTVVSLWLVCHYRPEITQNTTT